MRADNGIPGKFEITNANSTYPAMIVTTSGLGTGLHVNSSNTNWTGPAIDVVNSGLGTGLNVYTTGNAKTALFENANTTTNETNLTIKHHGLGRGVEINLTKPTNNFAGLFVNTSGNSGIEVVSAGVKGISCSASGNGAISINANTGQTANNAIGVRGATGVNVSNGIGVLGEAGANDPNGIGVKGIAGGNNDGGIGVFGEGKIGNPKAIGVKGIAYTHNEDIGAVTGINMTDGVGVFGEALGDDGIGVAGTVGNTGNHSVAGVFTNTYDNNNRAVVEILSNGKGNGIYIDHTNLTSSSQMLRIKNAGTGNFVQFENNLGNIRTTIDKDGDMVTDGTITVKENKGIVRNSSSTQLRTELITATFTGEEDFGPLNQFWSSPFTIPVTFGTAFSSPPAVYLGDIILDGNASVLNVNISNVTTTGCNIAVRNISAQNVTLSDSSWTVIAIGPE